MTTSLVFIVLVVGGTSYRLLASHSTTQPTSSLGPLRPLPEESPAAEGIRFTDVTVPAGIDFLHSIGDQKLDNLIESVGSGAAFLDYDQDGWLDLFVLNMMFLDGLSKGERPETQPTCRLYRNRGDGRFEDVTGAAGLSRPMFSLGVTVGDYDADGFPDLYLANYGPNHLFRNNGKGNFIDVTEKAGVGDPRCSAGAAFLDFDNDGKLDLYVVNYVHYDPNYKFFYQPDAFPGPLAYAAQPDALYRNRGDGTFENVTEQTGIGKCAARGMAASVADLDCDGDQDVFVANDAMAKILWINDGKGHFQDQANEWGVAYNYCGEGTAAMAGLYGDVDSDGLLDLFVPDNSFKALYCQVENRMFLDTTVTSGIAQICGQYVSWSSGLYDFDNDADVDLFCVNGALHHLWGEEDLYLENMGDGKFQDASPRSGEYFAQKLCGRGACFGDYDNDGDIDVFIVNLNDRAVLLRNDGGNRKHFLQIELEGTKSSRDAVGAVVEVVAGGKTQVAQRVNAGYLSSSDPRIHFGLGANEVVEKVRVRWPSGIRQELENVKANQVLRLKEPAERTGKP